MYASLIGPLNGIYYPLPFEDDTKNRIALNTSRLKSLWCSIYNEEETNTCILKYGGFKLPEFYANELDYDTYVVSLVR